ncbi:MAG: hypothetical protein AAGI37_11405 [Planctomycetota bacterium]
MRVGLFVVLMVTVSGCATSKPALHDKREDLAIQVDRLIEEAVNEKGYSIDFEGPVYLLQRLPPEAIPHLVEYLSDTRMTRCYPATTKAWQDPTPYSVHQLVAMAITRIADHYFWIRTDYATYSLRQDNPPEIATAFQYTIAKWWEKNQSLTMEQRKLIDLHDPVEHLNRFAALDWLKKQHSVSYDSRKALIERLEFLVREGLNSLTGEEAVRCAKLLARLDDLGAREAVGSLCNKMANGNPSLSNINSLTRMMDAHSAWARMGARERELAAANMKALKEQWYSKPRKLPPHDMKRIEHAWSTYTLISEE